ncbi:TlpA disulfide reductase family protein [uncultured Planktosalinus sp.]|uniref:TlpA family protein disulfide reductase n=1 Tax=uncultured Planktosalinus sp. TaxID=1810935 RepID=UPI0030DD0EDE|tara:strand:- start:86 stop:649 length:564 start_codon:yes stop_codon:yes gene_type:complete
MQFLKKHFSNILFGIFLLLLIIPQTRIPIQVFVQRLIAFSPNAIEEQNRESLSDFSWQLQDIHGDLVNLSDSKGKVILINLWATWCPPCIAEMPSLQELHNDYGEQVEFYFVSNEKRSTITTFLNKNEYDFPVYQSLEEPPLGLNSNALPTTYIIDKSGKIVINKTGVADWNSRKTRSLLDHLLGKS